MQSFLERYRGMKLGDVFADSTGVSIFDGSLSWLELPPARFLDYVGSAPRRPYDFVPDDPAVFRAGTTFLMAQAHRVWVTLAALETLLVDSPEFTVLDLGAYPFAVDEAIRNYLGGKCRILATVAQSLAGESLSSLAAQTIELLPVNLDPRVKVEAPLPGMTDFLPLPDASVDLALFAHVLEHLYQPVQILREISRVLKPGGKLLLSTDHGLLLGGFLNYLNHGAYLHEPVESTAAMVYHEWRGHVRFYTEGDIRALLASVNLSVTDCRLREVHYNSVPEKQFVQPNTSMPRWRADLLSEIPYLRNEILIAAEKETKGPA